MIKGKQFLHILLHPPVQLVFQQKPVQFPGLAPLPFLTEFLSHKEQFFAAMSEHIGIAQTQVGIFVHMIAGHLIDHGALQMHHLVVGQGQDIIFRAVISHGKGHAVMIVFAEIGIQLHIFAEIVHPSHIPFEGEMQSPFLDGARHLGPCRGFLRNGHHAGEGPADYGIKMFEKFNGLQVFIAAVFVRDPLAVLFAVVQVKHRRHRVHPQSVHMEFLNPEQGVGDEEVFHFRLAVVKNFRPPVGMFAQPRVGMLKKGFPVKIRQAMGVSGKMGGNPVQDHADFIPVKGIDQIGEVLRRPVAGCGRIIARHLRPPGTVKRMLRNPHQLHMGIFQFL